jgi:hypothetical protein
MPRGVEARTIEGVVDKTITPLAPGPLHAVTRSALAAATGAPCVIAPRLDRFCAPEDAAVAIAAHDTPEALAHVPRETLRRAVRRTVLDEAAKAVFRLASSARRAPAEAR